MPKPSGRGLFVRSALVSAGPPLVALPFWLAGAGVSEWSGSLAFYEVVAVPLALALVVVTFYRRTRWFSAWAYALALGGAAALGVGLWYLGLGLHREMLFRPDSLTAELMGIALAVQLVAAGGAATVVAATHHLRLREERLGD